jgi:nucleotide-binding universal stress UspA family protein
VVTSETAEIQRVLVAYSGSMESAKTMRQFVQLRAWPDVKLQIVTFDRSDEFAWNSLADAAAYCRAHGFDVETQCYEGSAKEQLLPYAAEWGADLLVIGNSARSLLVRRLFGETTLHVIRNADRAIFMSQ